ncbi:uncharacterized protein LOC109855805 isoform X2 [Pseudomyrmex gracilis]|uniref:uncharacterized protein LOC109855805 isoform X2 n=1 Tax=Pseudomyrmex gracilis TaxID=219809 RepID=UPI000994D72D|nr:uncharacterized protein LOC109855805 isoform X2 [Pseudomyrmex gracilis]
MAEDGEAGCPNNARLFQIAVTNSLRNIAESVSENEFLEILTILKSNPSTAKKLHKAMMNELFKSMSNDLNDIMKDNSLQDAFAKIEKFLDESTVSSNEDAWRPPGDITAHMRSLDAHKITEATEELEIRVNQMERENEILMETIAKGRSRVRVANDNMKRISDRASVALQTLEKTREQLATCLKAIDSE